MRADKVKAVESLVDKYGTVAMIGDGVNDAPAMAVAASLPAAPIAMPRVARQETMTWTLNQNANVPRGSQ